MRNSFFMFRNMFFIFRKTFESLLITVLLFSFSSCCETPIPEPEIERSVLIYMAANNNLSSYSFSNIEMIKNGGFIPAHGNILIYQDAPGASPRLFRLTKNGDEIVEELVEEYSSSERATDPTVLTRTLNRMQELFPAKNYGLILWSHANGWVPAHTFSSPIPSLSAIYSLPSGIRMEDLPVVKTFGEANRPGGGGYDVGMELNQLAQAIAASFCRLSFIVFDCCLMGGIETLYALRNVADYIIASPTEIMGSGFPYHLLMQPLFLPTADLAGVCNTFYNFYNEQDGYFKSATIALYRTQFLPELTDILRSLFAKYREELSRFSTANMQRFANTNIYYDLDQFISRLVSQTDYEAFKNVLDKVVTLKRNTDFFFSNVTSAGFIPVNHYGGISTYIPLASQSSLVQAYKETEWNKAVRLVE